MIIYFTDYNLSHKGGELLFLDEEIKPMYGDVVFFNSNELHKVNKTNGIRNALVIKFYDLDKLVNDN
jgi:predicted 2-oxoglutarate/Fe(II)-dependent dioxygenase YbiX